MNNCIFCRIASGEIPSKKVYEDDLAIAFYDLEPQAPVHVLIVPKKHYDNITMLDDDALTAHLFKLASTVAEKLGVKHGFRLVINTGKDGGQSVNHLHIHLLGGRELQWPPG